MFLTEEHNWIIGAFLFAIRYYLIAGILYFIFYVWKEKYFIHLKINPDKPSLRQLKSELLYSISTFFIYGLSTYLLIYWFQNGLTKIYLNINEYSYFYFFLSLVLMISVHDTYFYWSHKLMHKIPFLYRFHKIHHRSHNPNPWSAFSFHPIEALISL